MKQIEKINAIRLLGIDMIDEANSGHPGIVMGAAPMIFTLFTKHLNINSNDSKWFNRDRFVMSAGHGSALLYSMLYFSGYKLSMNDIKNFRKIDSKTPGHPEVGHTDGVDATSGPLGQGISSSVGLAMAEESLRAKTKNSGYVDHYTYAICGDGDLQEGVAFESMSIAGRQKLGRLIILMDSNDIQLDSPVVETTKINMKEYVESLGWDYFFVKDGEDVDLIDKALTSAKKTDKPSLIEVKTVIGFGSSKQGTPSVHGAPFGKEETSNIREKWGIKTGPFEFSDDIRKQIIKEIDNRVSPIYKKWQKSKSKYEKDNKDISILSDLSNRNKIKYNINDIELTKNSATRVTSGQILDKIQEDRNFFIGGSADLTASTKVRGINGNFDVNSREGTNIKFGVREFGMGAVVNGINLHGGLVSFASTFFTFADYMKPSLRMASIMKIPSIFIYTHDSVFVGEDGPTHEPVEQLDLIRSIPNFADFRPADTNELRSAWEMALSYTGTPSAIIATRQNLNEISGSSTKLSKKGAYKIYGSEKADIVIFSTGSEVSLSIDVAKLLENDGKTVKVVSILSSYVFDQQGKDYYKNLVGKPKLKVTIEAGTGISLDKYISHSDMRFNMKSYGLSGDGKEVYSKLGFDSKNILEKIKKEFK